MRKAYTLIEILLALTIAALTALLIFSLYHITARMLGDRENRLDGETAAVRALERLSRDLAGSLHAEMYDACAFDLSVAGHPVPASSLVSFCTTVRTDPQNEDLRWYEVHHVTYHLDESKRNGYRLVRVHQPLVGPGALSPPVTNTLAERIGKFEIAILHNEEWATQWRAEDKASWPRAARIVMESVPQRRETRYFQTEVLIPAGLKIKPTETRDTVLE